MYFEFNVLGWLSTQYLKANSKAQALEAATKIGGNEIYGFRQVSRAEIFGVLQDASLV